jgi:hypothetical protein
MNEPFDDELAKIRERMATYPTDLQLRFELAVALCNRGDYGTAILELQRAMSSPHVRLRAMALLAEAFDANGMSDLAAFIREQLSRESGEEGDSGSAPVPSPTRPVGPVDSFQARKFPDEDDLAA